MLNNLSVSVKLHKNEHQQQIFVKKQFQKMAKKEVKSESTEAGVAPVKRGRGRPKGSTKKGPRNPDGTFKPKIQLENAVPEGTKAVTKNTSSK